MGDDMFKFNYQEIEDFNALYNKFLKKEILNKENWKHYAIFTPQVGLKYKKSNKKLLFVGKATNGWGDFESVSSYKELLNDKFAEKLINYTDGIKCIVSRYESGKNEDGYNYKRSAFWRVIEKISTQTLNVENWHDYIAWTNLYKVAPAEKGNPSVKMMNKQFNICKEIFKKEVKILKPNYVIFFTSKWQGDNRDFLDLDADYPFEKVYWGGDKHHLEIFDKDSVKYIFSYHPQGKPEESHVKSILKVIS